MKLLSAPWSCRGRAPVYLSLGRGEGWSAKLLAGPCPESQPSLWQLRGDVEEAALSSGSLRILSSLSVMGEGDSSSKMENEMENVRQLLLRPGGTMAPRAPSIPCKGAGPVSLGTLSLAHTNTHTHIHSLYSEIHNHSQTSQLHIQWHTYVAYFQKHTSRHIREETCSEKYTNTQIHNLLSYHTHTLPNRHNRDSHYLGDPQLRSTPSHTHLILPDTLGHVPEMDTQSGETQPQTNRKYTYICRHTHTQTHADSFRTGASIHGNPQIHPCQVGTDTSSQPRYPPHTHTPLP